MKRHILTFHSHAHRHILHVSHNHDEWTWFRIWFSVLTVAASIILNLGVFTLLVAIHAALDVVKYRTKHKLSWHWTMVETVREGLVDVFFIVLGLLLGIAFHHSAAIGGLGRMARLEAMVLNLVLRVGPRLKIAEHILEIIMYYKHHFEEQFAPHAPLSRNERNLCYSIGIMACLIVLLPFATSLSWGDIIHTIQYELTPRLELGITHTITELQN